MATRKTLYWAHGADASKADRWPRPSSLLLTVLNKYLFNFIKMASSPLPSVFSVGEGYGYTLTMWFPLTLSVLLKSGQTADVFSVMKWRPEICLQFAGYKISRCRVNTTRRQPIKQLGMSFGSMFLLFPNENSHGAIFIVARENPSPHLLHVMTAC